MEISFFCENRDYLRVKASVPVRYRFIADHLSDAEIGRELSGQSRDLSGGGILLQGAIPDETWIPDLLMEKITLEVTVYLPDAREPVQALARAAWIDTGNADQGLGCSMGLKFVEISRDAQDRLFQYILHDLLP